MNSPKCDLCDRPAVVHEVTVKNGVQQEVHLCEQHALEAGVTLPTHQPLNELLTQFVITTKGGRAKVAARKACPGCGLTFARFRQVGTLGCPECYAAFDLPNRTFGTMYRERRWKLIVYHGLGVGELYDMEADPDEFTSLWDSPEHQQVKAELLLKSYDATMRAMPYGTLFSFLHATSQPPHSMQRLIST